VRDRRLLNSLPAPSREREGGEAVYSIAVRLRW